jgi:Fic family protein
MKFYLHLCLYIFFCFLSTDIPAQVKPFDFNLIAGNKDISVGKVDGITQDKYGYMWFVDQGNSQLVRYDGYRMKVFKNTLTEELLTKLGLNGRQLKAVLFVKEKGKITNKDYQQLNDCSRNTASNDLADLVQRDIFKPSDVKGAGAFYQLK